MGPAQLFRSLDADVRQIQLAQYVRPSFGDLYAAGNVVVFPAVLAAHALVDANAIEPMGQAKIAFDYTHLGAEGASFFAAMVADELAQQVPVLRRNLIP